MVDPSIAELRLKIANQVIEAMGSRIRLVKKNNRVCAEYKHRGDLVTKQWLCDRSSFYPSIHKQLSIGGTHTTAISQLVRWIRGQELLPLSQWKYWTTIGLPKKAVKILEGSDYPTERKCKWCGAKGRLDWYYFCGGALGCLPECEPIKEIQKKTSTQNL